MHSMFPLLLALLALTGPALSQTTNSSTTVVQTTPTTTTNNESPTTTTTGKPLTTTTTGQPVSNTLLVKALHVENPSGKAGGQPCSEFDFAGVPCKMQIAFGASLNTDECTVPTTGISVYGNSADLDYDATELQQTDGVFAGFKVCATLNTADGKAIDTFKATVDASQQQGIMTLTQPSGASVKFAWKSHVPPATPAPPTTTQATVTTNSQTEGPKGTTEEPAVAHDCDDFHDRHSGIREVYVGNNSLKVYCQYGAPNGSLMVIQSRGEKDNVDFDKFYEDYEGTFGTSGIGNNFWFGLDNMHTLTNGGKYNLFIEVCCGNNGTQQKYLNFTIGSKEEGYVLNAVAQSIGYGLDMASPNTQFKKDIGQKFSTYATYSTINNDEPEFCEVLHQDNWSNSNPQASNSTGGWWFGNCANNLNGAYLNGTADQCQLSSPELLDKGTGIEFKLDPGVDSNGDALTGRTFTRVRMAVYRADIPLFGIPTDSFCKDNENA